MLNTNTYKQSLHWHWLIVRYFTLYKQFLLKQQGKPIFVINKSLPIIPYNKIHIYTTLHNITSQSSTRFGLEEPLPILNWQWRKLNRIYRGIRSSLFS